MNVYYYIMVVKSYLVLHQTSLKMYNQMFMRAINHVITGPETRIGLKTGLFVN